MNACILQILQTSPDQKEPRQRVTNFRNIKDTTSPVKFNYDFLTQGLNRFHFERFNVAGLHITTTILILGPISRREWGITGKKRPVFVKWFQTRLLLQHLFRSICWFFFFFFGGGALQNNLDPPLHQLIELKWFRLDQDIIRSDAINIPAFKWTAPNAEGIFAANPEIW